MHTCTYILLSISVYIHWLFCAKCTFHCFLFTKQSSVCMIECMSVCVIDTVLDRQELRLSPWWLIVTSFLTSWLDFRELADNIRWAHGGCSSLMLSLFHPLILMLVWESGPAWPLRWPWWETAAIYKVISLSNCPTATRNRLVLTNSNIIIRNHTNHMNNWHGVFLQHFFIYIYEWKCFY